MTIKIRAFKYADKKTPKGYVCEKCGATGVKLYREYNTFLDHQSLLCIECSAKEQKINLKHIDKDGRCDCGRGKEFSGMSFMKGIKTDMVGMRTPAVPTEEGDSFWGYTSVPDDGCKWWKSIPTFLKNKKDKSNV